MEHHVLQDKEALRVRAYFLWLAEGQPADRDVDHWLQAEGAVDSDADRPPREELGESNVVTKPDANASKKT